MSHFLFIYLNFFCCSRLTQLLNKTTKKAIYLPKLRADWIHYSGKKNGSCIQVRPNSPWTRTIEKRTNWKEKEGTPVKQIIKKINLLVINKVQLETVITGMEIINEGSALFAAVRLWPSFVTNFSSAIFSSSIFLHHFFRQSPTFSFAQELSTLLKCNFHLFWGGGVLRCTKRRHTCSRYLSYFWRSFDDDKGDGNEKVNSIVNLRSFKLCRDRNLTHV